MAKGQGKVVAVNRKANHNFAIEETIEAGLVLQGTEIKSIRAGKVQIADAFVLVRNNEAWVSNMHISPYEQGNRYNHDHVSERKLLLHRHQIDKLQGSVKQDGYAMVPLKVYLKNGFAKLLIGLGKGKKLYDKRHDLRKKDAQREMERAFKAKQQY